MSSPGEFASKLFDSETDELEEQLPEPESNSQLGSDDMDLDDDLDNNGDNLATKTVSRGKGRTGQWRDISEFDFKKQQVQAMIQFFKQVIRRKKGFDPKEWQLNVSTVVAHGHDMICVAPTGSGKSVCYQQLCLRPNSTTIIISPLTELIREQVVELVEMGLNVGEFTGEYLAKYPDTWKTFEAGNFDVVVGSPEILLTPGGRFWRGLNKSDKAKDPFWKRLGCVILDEAHMMYKWGGAGGDEGSAFRPEFRLIGNFRMMFTNVPILCLSATINKVIEAYLHQALGLQYPTFRSRIPLYRHNIQFLVAVAQHTLTTFKDLDFILDGVGVDGCIPQTMVYTDDKTRATRIARYLRVRLKEKFPDADTAWIGVYNASQDSQTRITSMGRFRKKLMKIMICTEAAGMGLNIKSIELVVQYRVPKFLTLFDLMQRIGRAGRDPLLQAAGILLIEKRFFMEDKGTEEPVQGRSFQLAITKETIANGSVRSMLSNMYSEENRKNAVLKLKKKKKTSEDEDDVDMVDLDPSLLWLINTTGCRSRVYLACLDDIETAFDFSLTGSTSLSECKCDNCLFPPRLPFTRYAPPLCLSEGLNRRGIKVSERQALKEALIEKHKDIYNTRQSSIHEVKQLANKSVYGLPLSCTMRYLDSSAKEWDDILARKEIIQSRQTAKMKRLKESITEALESLRKVIYAREGFRKRLRVMEAFILPCEIIGKIARSQVIHKATSHELTVSHLEMALSDSTVFKLSSSVIGRFKEELVVCLKECIAKEEDLREREATVARESRRQKERSITPFFEDFEQRDQER